MYIHIYTYIHAYTIMHVGPWIEARLAQLCPLALEEALRECPDIYICIYIYIYTFISIIIISSITIRVTISSLYVCASEQQL